MRFVVNKGLKEISLSEVMMRFPSIMFGIGIMWTTVVFVAIIVTDI